MARLPTKVNYTKLVHQAHKTKSKVKTNKINAYAKWQKKLGKKSKGLDAQDKKLRSIHKKAVEADKNAKNKEKALQDLLEMLEGAFKELQTFKDVPVPGTMPTAPKNITALSSLAVVVAGYIAYIAAVKAYMALSEALSQKKP